VVSIKSIIQERIKQNGFGYNQKHQSNKNREQELHARGSAGAGQLRTPCYYCSAKREHNRHRYDYPPRPTTSPQSYHAS